MATVVINTIDGTRYKYYVRYLGGEHNWKYLGKASEVGVDAGVQDLSDEEIEEIRDGVRAHAPGGIALNTLEDPALREFTNEFSKDEIESVIDRQLFHEDGEHNYKHILHAIRDATNDPEIIDNIDTIDTTFAESPGLVEAAASNLEEKLGCKPFEVIIPEPKSDTQRPMVTLNVDEDLRFVENEDVNAELLEHANSNDPEETADQQEEYERWIDAVGGEQISDFKRSLDDPDALGFTNPGEVPATAGDSGRTPVTEISYIGDSKAEEMHPMGEQMALEDLSEMTEKQREWITTPYNGDLNSQIGHGIANTVPQIETEDTSNTLGRMLGWKDTGDGSWADPSNTVAVSQNRDVIDDYDMAPVADVEEVTDAVGGLEKYKVTNERGEESLYSTDQWEFFKKLADGTGNTIETTEDTPARVDLPDGGEAVVAARVQRD